MRPAGSRGIAIAFGAFTSVAAVWIVLQTMDVGEAAVILSAAQPAPVIAVVFVVGIQVTLRAFRWSFLLPTDRRVSATRLVAPLLVGYLGNAVLPARLGEPMRAVVVARRERVGTTEALSSVLVERIVDVGTLAPVALTAGLVVGAPDWTLRTLGVAAAGGMLVIVALVAVGAQPLVRIADHIGLKRSPAGRSIAIRFASALGGRERRSAILVAAVISTGAWLLEATSFWLAGQAVGADFGYAGAAFIAGVTVLSTVIPSAPGYVGTFELVAITMAGLIGVPAEQALAMAVVAHAMTLVPMALAGAVSVVMMGANLGDIVHTADARSHV